MSARVTDSIGHHQKVDLTEAQRRRMQMTYKNTEVSLKVLARRFDVSERTARKVINSEPAANDD